MRPDSPDGWQRLTCSCGTDRFATMFNLRWRAGSGLSQEPAGYFCLECHAAVDSAALIAKAQRENKLRELRDLEAEMQTEIPATKTEAKPKPEVAVKK